jgi:hypothetical protein
MKFVLLILVPIIIAVLVGSVTNSWVWGIVSFPIAMLLANWIAVGLFGRPSNKELRRITDRPVSKDLSKEELSLEVRQIASRFGSKLTNNQVPNNVLEMARFIARVKSNLSVERCGYLNTYGVYVRGGRNAEPTLPKEGFLYMVGGLTIPKLIFLDEDHGGTTVVKYEEGVWLKSLDLTYQKATKVWTAMQTNNEASIIEALFIDEADRPRDAGLEW